MRRRLDFKAVIRTHELPEYGIRDVLDFYEEFRILWWSWYWFMGRSISKNEDSILEVIPCLYSHMPKKERTVYEHLYYKTRDNEIYIGIIKMKKDGSY